MAFSINYGIIEHFRSIKHFAMHKLTKRLKTFANNKDKFGTILRIRSMHLDTVCSEVDKSSLLYHSDLTSDI